MNIPFNEIKLDERVRQDFGDVSELADSIATYGLIHPIAIDGSKTLIAGGRRHAALSKLLQEGTTIQPLDEAIKRFMSSGMLELGRHYTSKEDSAIDLLDEMELEENVRRKNFNWKEEVHAIAKIHRRKKRNAARSSETWGLRQTSELLGTSNASVSYALKLHACLQDPSHPIQECSSATDALHLLAKQRTEEARRLAVARSINTPKPKKRGGGTEISLDEIKAEFTPEDFDADADYTDILAVGSGRAVNDTSAGEVDESNVVVSLSDNVRHGNFLELLGSLPPVNHIITDPPYGIEMSHLELGDSEGVRNIDAIRATHDVKDNIANFDSWIRAFYEWLPDSGWLVMFCDMVHWNDLRLKADAVGFKSQRWPFVWAKTHSCMNQAADFNFTKNFEVALVARKGAATLVKPQASSYYQASVLPTKKLLTGHPFVKPLELWQHLAKAVALEGETIGDPFSGIGSMPRAMAEAGFKFVTCEIDEALHTQQMQMLMDFYREKFDNVMFL